MGKLIGVMMLALALAFGGFATGCKEQTTEDPKQKPPKIKKEEEKISDPKKEEGSDAKKEETDAGKTEGSEKKE